LGIYRNSAAESKTYRRRGAHDGLDGEIFVFKNLAVGVHTTSTQIVLVLFRIRSFPFLRQTGRTPSAESDDPTCFSGGMIGFHKANVSFAPI
jgi:hypothetical protein